MACCQCSHGPKAGFLPLLQLPGQVPWGATVSCAHWSQVGHSHRTCCCQIGEGRVLCWSLELKSARKTPEKRAGLESLVPLLSAGGRPFFTLPVWPWSPIPGHKRTEPYIQAAALCLVCFWSQDCGWGAQEFV